MDPDPAMNTPIALALAPLTEIIWDPSWPQFNHSAYIKSVRDACAEIMHFETFSQFCDANLRLYFERLSEFHDNHGATYIDTHAGWRITQDLFVQRITMWAHVQMVEVERFLLFVVHDKNLPLDVKIQTWDYQAEMVPSIRSEPIEYVLGVGLSRLVHASIDSYKAMSKHIKREGVYAINEYVSHLDYVTNQDAMWIAYANLDGTVTLDDILSFMSTADLDDMLVSQTVFELLYFNGFWEDEDLTDPLVWMGRSSNTRRVLESVYEMYSGHPDFGFQNAPMWDLDEVLDAEEANAAAAWAQPVGLTPPSDEDPDQD